MKADFKPRQNIEQILVVSKEIEYSDARLEKNHSLTLKTVESEIEKIGIRFKTVKRSAIAKQKNLEDYDLILTVGGDGTFLSASHVVLPNQVLFGVNSNPKGSYGAFCSSTRKNVAQKLKQILVSEIKPIELYRIKLTVNGNLLPIFALNDVLFAHPCPAGTSRYTIKIGKIKEEQKSSGIWMASAAGSSAAIHSAGGKKMQRDEKKIQFWVREPFAHPPKPYTLRNGFLEAKEKINLKVQMARASLFVDGAHIAFPLKMGDQIETSISKEPILSF